MPRTLTLSALLIPLLAATACAQEQKLEWQPLDEPGSGGWTTAIRVSPHDSKRVLIGGDMLGVGLSTDGGQSWGATSGFSSWEINDFTFDPKNPSVVWAGTLAGPYKSLDGGKTWVSKRQGFPKQLNFGFSAPVERVLIDPNNPQRLIAFGGSSRGWDLPGPRPLYGAVWESVNGGEGWTKIATIGADGNTDDAAQGISLYSMSFAAGSSKILYAGAPTGGFFVSTDGGRNWAKSVAGLPQTNVRRVVAHPTDPKTVWASLSNAKDAANAGSPLLAGGIFKSTDGGANWVSISTGLSQTRDKNANFTARYEGLAVCEANPDVMYTADTAWNTGVIYVTTDGGKKWRPSGAKGNLGHADGEVLDRASRIETAYPAGAAGTFLTVDPKNAGVAFSINSEHILKTSDSGAKWDDMASFKAGDNWRGRGFSGLCSWNFRFNPYKKGQSVLQSMDAGRAWVSDDGLGSWNYGKGLEKPQPWGGGKDATFAKDGTVYITTGQHGKFQGVGRSKDGGKSWQILAGGESGLPEWDTWNEPESVYTLPDDSARVWAVVGKKLFYSSDGGAKWVDLNLGQKLGHLSADPRDPLHFYVSGEKAVLETTDGQNFKAIGGPRVIGRVAVDSLGRLYVVADRAERGGLWRYDAKQPANARWARLFDDKQILGVAVDPTDPNRLAITTNMDPFGELSLATGVWISGDAGRSWSQQNSGLAMLRGHAVAFDPFDSETLVFGSFGRGFWKTKWAKSFVPSGGKTYLNSAEDLALANGAPPAIPIPKLQNGDMGVGEAFAQNWTSQWTGRSKLVAARDTTTFKSAPASLKLETTGDSLGLQVQNVEVVAGAKFTVSGWVKSRGNVKVNFMMQPTDAGYKPIGFVQVGFVQNESDWRQFSKEITIPKEASRANIGLLIEGEGTAWLDDVKITGAGGAVAVTVANAVPVVKAPVPILADVPLPAKSQTPLLASSRAEGDWPRWWYDAHKNLVSRLSQQPKPEILFFGDSITQFWAKEGKAQWETYFKPLSAANFGIAGDKVQNVLWRVQNGELASATPKLIVLKIGINNILGNNGTDAEIAAGIGQILTEFKTRTPNAKVLLLGILPSLDTNTGARKRIKAINAQLATFAGGQVRFLDIGAKFLTPEGTLTREISPDWVHLSAKGYEVFSVNIAPVIREMADTQG